MNCKRFFIAGLVTFVVIQAMEFLVNSVILAPTYESLKQVWRPDMMSTMWIGYLVGLLWTLLFTYIFIKGREGKGLLEGVRYGIIIWLFASVPFAHAFYVMISIPYSLCLQWCGFGLIEFLVAGILVAAIYKPAPRAA